MNAKSMTARRQLALDRRGPADDGVAEPGLDLGLHEPLRVRAQVEEAERVGRAEIRVLLDEGSGSASCAIRSRAPTGKWWPH